MFGGRKVPRGLGSTSEHWGGKKSFIAQIEMRTLLYNYKLHFEYVIYIYTFNNLYIYISLLSIISYIYNYIYMHITSSFRCHWPLCILLLPSGRIAMLLPNVVAFPLRQIFKLGTLATRNLPAVGPCSRLRRWPNIVYRDWIYTQIVHWIC